MEAKDLHKRLEEAANEYANIYGGEDFDRVHDEFITAAELGYKEAIKVAKEWIRDRNNYACEEWLEKECADFETYMNKLLEEN